MDCTLQTAGAVGMTIDLTLLGKSIEAIRDEQKI